MNKKITNILSELYTIDPSLKQHEDQLVKIIDKIITQKPNTHFDKAFVASLRRKLTQQESTPSMNSYFSKFGYLIGGAVVASLVLVPLLSTNTSPGSLVTDAGVNTEAKITMLKDNAFGEIAFQGDGYGAVEQYTITEESAADNAVDEPIPAMISSRPQSGGGGAQGLTRIADPDFVATRFVFSYAGEEFGLDQDTLEVLRRNTTPSRVGGLASQFGLGLVDLQQLNDLQFESISLMEGNNRQGLRVNIDTRNGQISLHNELPIDYYTSSFREPLRPQDVPDDQTLINTANGFIEKYNINLDQYGEPEVNSEFKNQLELVRTNPDYYTPEYATVVYPLTIREIPVYDQGGNQQGVQATIHIPTMQVTAVYGLALQQYDASAYPIESNIQALITQKQEENNLPPEITANDVEVKLGTPELVYGFTYFFNNGNEQQLYVPAYLFPVLEKPAGHPYYPSKVIIPLVQAFNERPVQILPAQPLIDTVPPPTAPSPEPIQ